MSYSIGKTVSSNRLFFMSLFDDENLVVGITDDKEKIETLQIPIVQVLESGAINLEVLTELINKNLK